MKGYPDSRFYRLRTMKLFALVPLTVLLFIFLRFVLVSWSRGNAWGMLPGGWDSNYHLDNTLFVLDWLTHRPTEFFHLFRQMTESVKWPPLLYVLNAPLLAIHSGPFSFFLLMILVDCSFVIFFYLAALPLVRDKKLALLAVIIMTANPVWLHVAMSYNLEMIAHAGLAAFMAIVLREPQKKGPWAALLLGVICGLLMLTKTVILIFALTAILALFIRQFLRHEFTPATFGNFLLYLIGFFIIVGAWHFPQLRLMIDYLVQDVYQPVTQTSDVKYYYLRVLFGEYAIAPLLIFFSVAAFFGHSRLKFSTDFPRIAVPLAAMVIGFLFFALLSTQRSWYLLPCYMMLLLVVLTLLDQALGKFRQVNVLILLTVYSAIALLNWHPATAPVSRALSLYSHRPSTRETMDWIKPKEAQIARQLLTRFSDEELKKIRIVTLGEMPLYHMFVWLKLRRPQTTHFINRRSYMIGLPDPPVEKHLVNVDTVVTIERMGEPPFRFSSLCINLENRRSVRQFTEKFLARVESEFSASALLPLDQHCGMRIYRRMSKQ